VPPAGTKCKLNAVADAVRLQKYIVVTASPLAPVLTKIFPAVVSNAVLVIAILNP
jgi:hypothetical protein